MKNIFINFLKRNLGSFWFQSCAAVFIFLALCSSELFVYLTGELITGWDSLGHYTAINFYAENVFPKMWGYFPYWYSGSFIPNYYPPLFYFFTTLVHILTHIDLLILIKIISVGALIGIIIVTISIARLYSRENLIFEWTSVIMASMTPLISKNGLYSAYGADWKTLSQVGLLSYIFTYFIFLLFIRFVLSREFSKKNWLLSTIFLTMVLLGNANLVPVAALLLLIICFYDILNSNSNIHNIIFTLVYYGLIGISALLISSIWWLPMIYYYDFFPSVSVVTPAVLVPLFLKATLPIIIITWYYTFKDKNKVIYTGNIFISIMIILLLIQEEGIFSNLTLHVYRWSAFMFTTIVFMSGYIVSRSFSEKNNLAKVIMVILSLISIFNYVKIVTEDRIYLRNYKIPDYIDQMVNYISYSQEPGLIVNVEKIRDKKIGLGGSDGIVLENLLSNKGVNVSWGTLRESSISSVFYTPIRNYFSSFKEEFAIQSYMDSENILESLNIDDKLSIAKYMGINMFVVKSTEIKKELDNSPFVIKDKNFGGWQLYKSKQEVKRAEALKFQPVLLFSDLNFKDRDIHEYTFARFQELLMVDKQFDITFVYPQVSLIDKEDLANYSVIVIDDYQYKDKTLAINKLLKYSEDNFLILFEDEDKLFSEIMNLKSSIHNIITVPRVASSKTYRDYSEIKTMDDGIREIFRLIKTNNREINENVIVNINFEKDKIVIDLNRHISKPIPILIKTTFSPQWQTISGDRNTIYLATPTHMVIYTDDDLELYYQPPNTNNIMYMIPILTIFIIIISIILDYKNIRVKIKVS